MYPCPHLSIEVMLRPTLSISVGARHLCVSTNHSVAVGTSMKPSQLARLSWDQGKRLFDKKFSH